MPSLCVFTHRDSPVVSGSIDRLIDAARAAGVELRASQAEADKHPQLAAAAAAADAIGWPEAAMQSDAAIVLAGDGTLLRVLNQLRGGPPVLGVNYGMLGYLSGITQDSLELAVERLASGDYRVVELPVLQTTVDGNEVTALNDIVASGGVTGRIIELGWRVVSRDSTGTERVDEMGPVPCDGMVLATPVGSTAYNLSNGGPVLAWGVRGFVVSFIAPHTLSARPLLVDPSDAIELEHLGRGAELKVLADGEQVGQLQPGERLRVHFGEATARLALIDDTTFYARYRDNFATLIHRYDAGRGKRMRLDGDSA